MAYTSLVDTYREIDPVKDYLPYDDKYDKDFEAQQAKAEEFMKAYYSAPEILKRDESYTALNNSISNRVNQIADAITSRDLLKLRSIARQGNLLQDKAKWDAGVKKAEKLSSLIEEQRKAGPNAIFDIEYNEHTPLDSITDQSSYHVQDASTYEALGKSIGTSLSTTAPDVVGSILNNTVALLRSGKSYKEVLDMISNSDSQLAKQIAEIKRNSGITTAKGLQQITDALTRGVISGAHESYSHINDPNYKTRYQRKYEAEQERQLEIAEAVRAANKGDWSKLEELGEASPIVDPEDSNNVQWYYNNKLYHTRKKEDGTYELIKITNVGSNKPASSTDSQDKSSSTEHSFNVMGGEYTVTPQKIKKAVSRGNITVQEDATVLHIRDANGNIVPNNDKNAKLIDLITKLYNGEKLTPEESALVNTNTPTSTTAAPAAAPASTSTNKLKPYTIEGKDTEYFVTTDASGNQIVCDASGNEIPDGTKITIENRPYHYKKAHHKFVPG